MEIHYGSILTKITPKKIQGVSTRDFKMGGANVGEAERLTKNVCISAKDLTRISRIFLRDRPQSYNFFASQKLSRFLVVLTTLAMKMFITFGFSQNPQDTNNQKGNSAQRLPP